MLENNYIKRYEDLYYLVEALKKNNKDYSILFNEKKSLKDCIASPINWLALTELLKLLPEDVIDSIVRQINWQQGFDENLKKFSLDPHYLMFIQFYPDVAKKLKMSLKLMYLAFDYNEQGLLSEERKVVCDKLVQVTSCSYNGAKLERREINDFMQKVKKIKENQYSSTGELVRTVDIREAFPGASLKSELEYDSQELLAPYSFGGVGYTYGANGYLTGQTDLLEPQSSFTTREYHFYDEKGLLITKGGELKYLANYMVESGFQLFDDLQGWAKNKTQKYLSSADSLVIALILKSDAIFLLSQNFYLLSAEKHRAFLGLILVDMAFRMAETQEAMLAYLEKFYAIYLFPFKTPSIEQIKGLIQELDGLKGNARWKHLRDYVSQEEQIFDDFMQRSQGCFIDLLASFLLLKAAEFHKVQGDIKIETQELILLRSMTYAHEAMRLQKNLPEILLGAIKMLLWEINSNFGQDFESVAQLYSKIQYYNGDKIDPKLFFRNTNFSYGFFKPFEEGAEYTQTFPQLDSVLFDSCLSNSLMNRYHLLTTNVASEANTDSCFADNNNNNHVQAEIQIDAIPMLQVMELNQTHFDEGLAKSLLRKYSFLIRNADDLDEAEASVANQHNTG